MTFRGAGASQGFSVATTVTPPMPPGLLGGDVYFAHLIFHSAPGTITAPAGWILIKNQANGVNPVQAVYYKVAGGTVGSATTDTAPTFSWVTSSTGASRLLAWFNIDQTTPIMQQTAAIATAAPSITAAKSATVISFFAGTATSSWSVSPGAIGSTTSVVSRGDTFNSPQDDGNVSEGQLAAGATGSISLTGGVSPEAILVALNPDSTFATTSSAGTAQGNVIALGSAAVGNLAIMAAEAGTTIVTPTGWTAIYNLTSPQAEAVFYKILNAADIATPPTLNTGQSFTIVLVGHSVATPINTNARADYSGTSTYGFPAVTPSVGGTRLLALAMGAYAGGGTITNDASLTRFSGAPFAGGAGQEIDALWKAGPAAGVSSGVLTHTNTNQHIESDITIAVNGVYAPPSAPTLNLPANASYQDLAAGFTFTWTDNFNAIGDTQSAYAMRRKIGAGAYEYWNAGTVAWQSTIIWNSTATQSVVFAASKWTDGNVYNWSVATQSTLGPGGAGSQGPFASDATVTASVAPTATVVTPSGTVAGATPAVSWTEVLQSGASQTAYQVVVESGGFGTTPGSGITAWDSGVVASAALNVIVGVSLTNGASYRAFVQVTETGGQTSTWATIDFTVIYNTPATPTMTGVWDAANARAVLSIQGRDNLLTADDSSFEATVGTWVAQTNCTVARSTAQFLNGTASLALTSSAAGSMTARTAQGVSGNPVIASKQYTIMASFRAAASPRTCTVTVNWWQASGTASAVRASDTSTGAVDATGAWSANLSLTVTSPSDAAFASISVTVAATAAANEVHYVDQIDIGPGAGSPWTIGGLAASGSFTLEYSEDGGTTWKGVRGASALVVDSAADQQVTAYDYERTPGVAVLYRVRVSDGSGSTLVTSANSSTVSITSVYTSWWVKDVTNPAFNLAICDAQQHVRNRKGDSTAVYPAGRTNPLVLRGPVHGADGQMRTVVSTEADRTSVLNAFTALASMLLQDPRGRQWYAEWVGDLGETQVQTDSTHPIYAIQRNWVEVDVPS